MGVMDLEVQRERRLELLREAESRRVGRSRPTNRRKEARGIWGLVSAWMASR